MQEDDWVICYMQKERNIKRGVYTKEPKLMSQLT